METTPVPDNKDMERNQVILKINYVSTQNGILYHVGNTTLWIIEIICYLILIACIRIAFLYPTLEMAKSMQMTDNDFAMFKAIFIFLAVFMLIPSYICQTLRRKNHKLKEVNRLSGEYIKNHNVIQGN